MDGTLTSVQQVRDLCEIYLDLSRIVLPVDLCFLVLQLAGLAGGGRRSRFFVIWR